MTPPDPARRLSALLRRARRALGPRESETWHSEFPVDADPLLLQFLFSLLAWEAGPAKAAAGLKRLLAAVVDTNELRVCLPDEIAAILGDRYPRGLERASRLRAALNDLYKREHAVTLAPLAAIPKRDARAYVASLEGMPAYAAARLCLLSLGVHAFPLDERLHALLREGQAVPADLGPDEAAAWLERHFRAGEAAPAYLLLEAWSDERAQARGRKAAPAKATPRARPKRMTKPQT